MKSRGVLLGAALALWGGFVVWFAMSVPSLHAQQPEAAQGQAEQGSLPVIKAESRLVLVDAIVTDKHGNYIRDLSQKDFKVFEDEKEQTVKTFSYGSDPNSPTANQKHYMVLFFDNSSMDVGDQAMARQAAAKFIDANAGPEHYMAVINYGGSIHVSQNFTADAERLKRIVSGVKTPNVNSSLETVDVASDAPFLAAAEVDYSVRTMLLGLRSVAKNLAHVPGRKSLILLTSGFEWNPEVNFDLTSVIAVCNKANVAIYPVDVRGLKSPYNAVPSSGALHNAPDVKPAGLLEADLDLLQMRREFAEATRPHLMYVFQKGGTGGTGGRGGSTGGTGGRPGGPPVNTHGGYTQPQQIPPMNQPRTIIPPFPQSAATNQQVLYQLAAGTGGFVIANTNDLEGGMGKVAREQAEYYTLGYTPPESADGSCHTLSVKVDRSGIAVRARSGYCNAKPVDFLAGKAAAKDLENRALGAQHGNIPASILAPYFFTGPNAARVNLALEMPSNTIKFEKDKGKERATVNILGLVTKADGAVAARFSDAVSLNFEKDELKAFLKKPYNYETQFEVAAGEYTLKVVFSQGGESFGKMELPLKVESYDGKQFTLSAVALSKQMHKVGEDTSLDSELLEDRKPLVTQGLIIVPAGSSHFKKSDTAAIYVEAYEPLLTGPKPPKISLELKIIDRKTGETKVDAGVTDTSSSIKQGNPVVPLGLQLPLDHLMPGSYRLELMAVDSAGQATKTKSADFEIE